MKRNEIETRVAKDERNWKKFVTEQTNVVFQVKSREIYKIMFQAAIKSVTAHNETVQLKNHSLNLPPELHHAQFFIISHAMWITRCPLMFGV